MKQNGVTGTMKEVEKAKREVRELGLLWEISRFLGQSMDLRAVVGMVLSSLAEHMGMSRGTLTLLNRRTGEILIEAAHGLSEVEKRKGSYRVGEGITGKVVQTGEPVVVPHISEEPHFLNRTGSRKDLRKKDISFICVPIKIGNEVIGTLSADRLFDETVALNEDVRLLTIIASMVAQAVKMRQEAMEERE
ncbi:MAG TPA: GAF domain-containing protein, partial [Syntrophales bacterium]|nr:GAF domain-containing protein [Syntrophales bacterium]